MKLIWFLFLFANIACGSTPDNFVPDNNLWREDCLTCESNGVTQELFNKIVEAGRQAYQAEARANNEQLVVNPLWNDATVNANCCRGCTNGEVTVNMYGGLARRPEIIPEGFALVLGHELSHAYGGTPYIDSGSRMSAEGQADYEGAKTAYRRIAALVPELKQDFDPSEYIKNACKNDKDCEHSLVGGLSLGNLLATLSGEKTPAYETPDATRVSRTETSYPQFVQCRVDTYLAGTLRNGRPACWFKSSGPTPTPNPTPIPTAIPTPEPTPIPTPDDPWGYPDWPTWPDWPWDWPW